MQTRFGSGAANYCYHICKDGVREQRLNIVFGARTVINQWLTSSASNDKVPCSILATNQTTTEYLSQVKSRLLCFGGCVEPSVPRVFSVAATAVVSSPSSRQPVEGEALSPSVCNEKIVEGAP
ncbi:hypothetical protein EVAR_58956_1 [Eumeta japonica]|uniref:Uncharacterized protein n=1 Tax=Eumeta variegata TaxID=151549 RepID=A0A4C1YI09_EUMVA|nr:hypothetical protein EVAR_58956_1 [Eumeta japonica]